MFFLTKRNISFEKKKVNLLYATRFLCKKVHLFFCHHCFFNQTVKKKKLNTLTEPKQKMAESPLVTVPKVQKKLIFSTANKKPTFSAKMINDSLTCSYLSKKVEKIA